MDIRPATAEAILSVLARLSDQHEAEYDKAGGKHMLVDAMMSFCLQGDTNVLWFDEQPQAVLAIKPCPPVGTVTWLAVTKEFFEKGISSTKAARRYMFDAVKRHGQITSFVGSDHPGVVRWMQLIGFELVRGDTDPKIFLFKA